MVLVRANKQSIQLKYTISTGKNITDNHVVLEGMYTYVCSKLNVFP